MFTRPITTLQKTLRICAYAVLIAIVGVMGVFLQTSANAASVTTCSQVPAVAHRGYPGPGVTENTIRAYQRAINNGAKHIEVDMRLTSDGQWMSLHDPTVNRTTNGTGEIRNKTVAEVKALTTNDGTLGGIPTFDEIVTLAAANGTGIQLDMKLATVSDARIMELVTKLRETGLDDVSFFASGHTGTLSQLKRLAPDITRGWIIMNRTLPTAATVKQYAHFVNISDEKATSDYIDRMHRNGVKVLGRGAHGSTEWSTMIRRNIDRLMIDDIGRYNNWCSNMS